jgi:hypothetical protein
MKKLWGFVKESKTKLLAGVMLAQFGNTSTSSFFPDLMTSNNTSLASIVKTVLNMAFVLAGVIAVVYLIWGGYQYITSAGGEGSEAGKKTIINAIIGLIIVIAAFAIANYIWTLFGFTPINQQTF